MSTQRDYLLVTRRLNSRPIVPSFSTSGLWYKEFCNDCAKFNWTLSPETLCSWVDNYFLLRWLKSTVWNVAWCFIIPRGISKQARIMFFQQLLLKIFRPFSWNSQNVTILFDLLKNYLKPVMKKFIPSSIEFGDQTAEMSMLEATYKNVGKYQNSHVFGWFQRH